MESKKVGTIVVIVLIAIIAIAGIIFISGKKDKTPGIEIYIGKASKSFENKLINDYKELRKFTKESSVETVNKNYQAFNVLETFNEDYFKSKKIAVISVYEDNASVYEYHIDEIKYNEDKTVATINYTNKKSGYSGTLTSSWTNCMLIELEETVKNVNFNEIKE